MMSAGLAYTFSIYSDSLKDRFNLSQTQLAGLGTACNLGGYLALPSGFLFDSMKSWNRMGPVVTISIGAILNTGGYFALWAAAVGKFDPPYWVLLIVCLVACNGQTWLETAALVTCVQNFETERGTVIGILKAMLGLSASVYTAIYVAFLDPNSIAFLLLLAILPSVLAIFCVLFINRVPFIQSEPHTKSHAFHLAFTAIIGLAIYQGVIAAARNAGDIDIWSGILMIAAVAILLLPLLAIPFIFGGFKAKKLKPKLSPELLKSAEEGGFSTDIEQPLLGQVIRGLTADTYRDKTPLKCFRSGSFWMLITINAIGSGAGLTLLNNLGEETYAVQGHGQYISRAVFVSMFSIANCLGRLASGFIPDKLMRKRSMPRTTSLVFLSGLTLLAALLNAVQSPEILGVASLLSGLAFGGFQGVVPAITSEIFGLRNFATNYAMIQLGPAAGSYFLATYLAGTLFDREARKFKHGACKGPACFRLAFLVIAGFALLALILSVVLHRRTKHLYHRVVEDTKAERKRRGREAEIAEERFMLRRTKEENEILRSFFLRYKNHLADLQGLQPNMPDEAQQLISELHGLSSEADNLMASYDKLWETYSSISSLPGTPR